MTDSSASSSTEETESGFELSPLASVVGVDREFAPRLVEDLVRRRSPVGVWSWK